MRARSESWLGIAAIAVVTLLTYGLLIAQLGFYRDDWYLLWAGQAGGSPAIIGLFQSDRPLIGYIFALFYDLLGAAPIGWHLLALALRLIGNLAFLWLVRQLWPARSLETAGAALLFAVYPGFVQQPNAGVFVIHLLANAAAVLSLALTVAALLASRAAVRLAASVSAVVLAAFYLGCLEYMIGLELARPALIAYVVWRAKGIGGRPLLVRTARYAAPYVVTAAAFACWRLFIFESTRHATNVGLLVDSYRTLPLRSLVLIGVEALKDAVDTSFFAWAVPFYRFTSRALYRDLGSAAALALTVGIIVLLYLGFLARRGTAGKEAPTRGRDIEVLLGFVFVIAGLLPINAAGRNVLFDSQWDRYALPVALGVALVVSGLAFAYIQPRARLALLSLLVAMSAATQFLSAAWYRDFWRDTRDLWWQMIWRAPAIEPGTMLFVPASDFAEGYEIYGPANMIYFPGQPELQLGAEVLVSDTAALLLAQESLEHYDRDVHVPDNFDKALMAIFPTSSSCLHVLDGRAPELPGFIDNSLVSSVAEYSRLDRIDTGSPRSARPDFLGTEPARGWCYYYQAIQLARQRQDWQAAANLMDEALQLGLQPLDASEWMPAVEAYTAVGRPRDARRAASILRANAAARYYLCEQAGGRLPYTPPYDAALVEDLICRGGK